MYESLLFGSQISTSELLGPAVLWRTRRCLVRIVRWCSCSPAVRRCAPWPLGRRFAFFRFLVLLSNYQVSFIVIVTELPNWFRYNIILSLSTDSTETFDTISNTITSAYHWLIACSAHWSVRTLLLLVVRMYARSGCSFVLCLVFVLIWCACCTSCRCSRPVWLSLAWWRGAASATPRPLNYFLHEWDKSIEFGEFGVACVLVPIISWRNKKYQHDSNLLISLKSSLVTKTAHSSTGHLLLTFCVP